jgi:hypothetical protein
MSGSGKMKKSKSEQQRSFGQLRRNNPRKKTGLK